MMHKVVKGPADRTNRVESDTRMSEMAGVTCVDELAPTAPGEDAAPSPVAPHLVCAEAPPPAPDTSHLGMGEPGDPIPNLTATAQAVQPDTSGIDLSPEGTDFADCAAPEAPEPALDLSGLDLAEAGSEVLEERYRRVEAAAAPATDHLSLED